MCKLSGQQLYVNPIYRAVKRSSPDREVWGLNLVHVKSDTVLPTACYCCNTFSTGAVLPGRNDAEMDSSTRYTLRRNSASVMKNWI